MSDYESTQIQMATQHWLEQWRRRDERRENRAACDRLLDKLELINLRWVGSDRGARCPKAMLPEIERLADLAGTDFRPPRDATAAHDRVLIIQEAFMIKIPGDVFESEDAEWAASTA